jgi:hypothetical protein
MVAGAALALIAFAPPSAAQPVDDRDITDPPATSACPVDRSVEPAPTPVPEDSFTDVPEGNVHEFAVDCVAWYGVASGTSETTYDPGGPVHRDQMASFIARLLDYVADEDHAGPEGPGQRLPAAPAENQFPCDVDPSSVHYESIQRLAAAGIVDGTGTNGAGEACFDPGGTVTRAQMATFISEAEGYTDNTRRAVADANVFVDDDGDTHEESINILALDGITKGIGTNAEGGALFGPALDVKRDQMASFLARTLDLLVEEGMTMPPSAA